MSAWDVVVWASLSSDRVSLILVVESSGWNEVLFKLPPDRVAESILVVAITCPLVG